MKKLLLGSAAVVLGLGLAAPAQADGVELDLGGYFKGYGAYVSQDDDTADYDSFGMIRDTEIHFSGEYTLDNGLTVGAHVETGADGGDSFDIDESYAYFSGSWGRVNAGLEDGAAYLLQVAAPSADSNYDGVRQYIQPFNDGADAGFATNIEGLDYANDLTTDSDKITYLSPVFSGFQVGASYSFGFDDTADDLEGVNSDDDDQAWEIAARYEGQFDAVGFAIGAGYIDAETADGAQEGDEWNIGLDLDWGAFGFGAAYLEGEDDFVTAGTDVETETWVLGADYTTGAYKLGASYYTTEVGTFEADRYTAGAVYTYGPGLTFRGSISFLDAENGADDADGTSVLLGTQINF